MIVEIKEVGSDDIEKLSSMFAEQVQDETVRWLITHHSSSDLRYFLAPARRPYFLFRGQNHRHVPCNATRTRLLSRQITHLSAMSASDLSTFAANLLKLRWFCKVAREHPAIQWANSRSIYFDPVDLSQHYGIPTDYVDLTQSFDIAMFFATSRKIDGSWLPMTEGYGIVYFFNYEHFRPKVGPAETQAPRDQREYANMMREVEERLKLPGARPIGYQPMPRPAEQWGWVFKTIVGQDFEQVPYVSAITFSHSRQLSQKYLEKFNGGQMLFPEDATAVVAERILAANMVPYIEPILDRLRSGQLMTMAEDELNTEVDSIMQGKLDLPAYTAEQRAQLAKAWQLKRADFFQNVGYRLVRTTESGRLEQGSIENAIDGNGNLVAFLQDGSRQ
jgi:hypothetical protein